MIQVIPPSNNSSRTPYRRDQSTQNCPPPRVQRDRDPSPSVPKRGLRIQAQSM